MSENTSVLLFSSNLRRRYAEDILTAIALPRGAVIQFRYGAPYVTAELQQRVATQSILGTRAVIAFIADFPGAEPSPSPGILPFIVPVRAARFVYARSFADFFILRLQVDDYPDLSQMTRSEVRERSRVFYDHLVDMNQRYYPAVTRFPNVDLGDNPDIDDSLRWLSVVERLALHNTFASSYFVRMEQPTLPNGKTADFDAVGRLSLRDGQTTKLNVNFLGKEYSEQSKKVLMCATDGRFLRVSSDNSYEVAHRYDSVEFWLQPNTENFDSLARVTIRLETKGSSTSETDSYLTTSVNIPVVVKRSRPRLALRLSLTAGGAILVALPAILGQHSSLRVRIVAAVLGAFLLAYATVMVSRGDR